jgi:predicted DCC family thiol-disulfide oxidoreductase YuxK
MKAMQFILPGGRVLSGERALPEIISRLNRYQWLACLFKLPGSGIFSRAFYRWFANRRYRIARILFRDKTRN